MNRQATGKEYWRSLDDFVDSPDFRQFIENEFPSQLESVITPGNRRTFLKLMGASLALAGAGLQGCRRWPDEKIAPFAHRPENYVPGEPEFFATTFEKAGVGYGLVAKSYDGRPIKVEGNEAHPVNGSSSDHWAQSGLLEMYDPDRSRFPVERHEDEAHAVIMADFRKQASALFTQVRSRRGEGMAILARPSGSESYHDMRRRLQEAMPNAQWYEYEPITRENEIRGSRLAFGEPKRAQLDFTKADVTLCLDSDVLGTHPAASKHAREFMARRDALDATMPRLYAVEATLSLTGANADHRLAIRSREVAAFAASIAVELGKHGVRVLGADALTTPMQNDAPWVAFAAEVAKDLASAGSHAMVTAGPRQPAEVHALAYAINFALGAVGTTINFTAEPQGDQQLACDAIRAFSNHASEGRFDTLVIIGGNPVYDAPADVRFADAIAQITNRIHLSAFDNETSHACTWHVPMAHWLESWGDSRGWDGTISAQQPLIDPLYDGLSPSELLAMISGDEVVRGYDIVRRWFRERRGESNFEAAWRTFIHEGVLADSSWAYDDVELDASRWARRLNTIIGEASSMSGIEVNFVADYKVWDGEYANNGWLQELPDPLAKICWDNAAFLSPHTADELGVRGNDLVVIELGDAKNGLDPSNELPEAHRVTVPVHIVPGHAHDSVTLNLGYGREAGGHIARGVGFDVYPIRVLRRMHFAVAGMTPEGGTYPLATVQDHHAMDTEITERGKQSRLPRLVREASLDGYMQDPRAAIFGHEHDLPIISLWESHSYEPQYLEDGKINPDWSPNKWAMTIDLNKCTGCSACMIACQAENNVPIVGKAQVMVGREMHWIRIDRYFRGSDLNNPSTVFQPVTCMHCETAPCEQVCPVAATVHDRDGLNVMVYNRCVGTRYCSNNCPYKVRRFNFYDWYVEDPKADGVLRAPTLEIPDEAHRKAFTGEKQIEKMRTNPEVTVRPRGVMEKCSYCLQRINRAKINAKNEWVKLSDEEKSRQPRSYHIPDDSFTTACAQACPTEAIVFGDLHDEQSKVSQRYRSDRLYSLLDELNTQPRTRYLANIRNLNKALPLPAGFDAGASHGTNGEDHDSTGESGGH